MKAKVEVYTLPGLFFRQIVQIAVADVEVKVVGELCVGHGFFLGDPIVAVIQLLIH